jgi:septal ring factor EnvC (AmiA/AmiB activator)
MADTTRALHSRRMLATVLEDTKKAEVTLITSRDQYAKLSKDISSLETKLAALREELSRKKTIVSAAEKEMHDMEQIIGVNNVKKAGLCIRLVD